MKKSHLCLFLIVLAVSSPSRAQIVITGFGSGDLNPFNTTTDFVPPWTGTQTSTTISVSNVSNQLGGIYSILATPINITGSTAALQLTASLNGSTPVADIFQLNLYDSSLHSLSYNFTWSGFTGGPAVETAPLIATTGTFNGVVSSYGLTLFGTSGDIVSATFYNLSASSVPEPSAWLLLSMGLGCIALRPFFRRVASKV